MKQNFNYEYVYLLDYKYFLKMDCVHNEVRVPFFFFCGHLEFLFVTRISKHLEVTRSK